MDLLLDVGAAINAGLTDGCRMQPGPTWEIDALVGLFRTGLPELAAVLAGHFPGAKRRVAGIFCHGRPKVTMSAGERSGERCELGDLLLLTTRRVAATTTHRALLLQTKNDHAAHYPPRWDPAYKQLVLYTQWPEFSYFGGLDRDVHPKSAHAGAQYGFLDVCGRGCERCTVRVAVPEGRADQPLASALADLIRQSSGLPVRIPPDAGDTGWDRVVADLLARSANELFRWRRASAAEGAGAWPRSYTAGLFLAPTGSPPPLALQRLVASPDFQAEHDVPDAAATLAEAFADDAFGPPGEDDPELPRWFDDDPDRGLSIAIVELDFGRE